jgi:hypothetical protein
MKSTIEPEVRSQILASSVLRAIALSSDALADRRDEEVAAWLRPWISRYRMLVRAVGRELGDDAADDSETASDAETPVDDVAILAEIQNLDLDSGELIPWPVMDRFILNQEIRYFSTDDVFASSNEGEQSMPQSDLRDATMWTDFLSVAPPPGYTDRWTLQWEDSTLPAGELAWHRSVMSDSTRQNIMRAGLFVVLAAFLLVSFSVPRPTRPNGDPRHRQNPERQRLSWFRFGRSKAKRDLSSENIPDINLDADTATGATMKHPAFWLFVLGVIGLPVIPTPMSSGLIVVSAVLAGIDPGYAALLRWRRSKLN